MNSPAGLSENRIIYLLARVNAGLATQWSQMAELAAALERTLDDAQALGQPHVPSNRRSEWDEAWHNLRETFGTIRSLVAETRKRFTAENPSSDPLEPWSDILEREQEFGGRLATIRVIGAGGALSDERSPWLDLCTSIQSQIATLNAQALAVRLQLELRQKYGAERADVLTKQIAKRLPADANIADAGKYAAEYRKAYEEFEHEKETFEGGWDVLKALMLIQPKRPEERVRDKHHKDGETKPER